MSQYPQSQSYLDEEDNDYPSPGPRKSRITMWVILSLLGVMIIGTGSVALYIWNGLRPTASGDVKRIEVKNGMSPFMIAESLEDEGIIRSAFLFKYYLKLKDEGTHFQAGSYDMAPGMKLDAVIAKLNAGETVKAETIKFTIPEGFTVKQIADELNEKGIASQVETMKLVDADRKWEDVDAILQIPATKSELHRLEGYLFPETYEVKKGSTAEDVVHRMLSEMDRKLDSIPELDETLAARGITLHQLLTVASLVEREVVVDEERGLVAGVIYNRLKQDMPLQIDATVQYLLDKQKERLMEKDLDVDSPYNTYKTKGLPPGPIASPSLKSIQAALSPETTDYVYYVTKKDGSHTHLFAKTYKQHLRNIELSNETAKQ
ncbi:endolytic transglycosylase MltG [Paenibacillus sp. MMS18-CY102]|uniref:endolytic transglycosylase MltG n=1 Tax=Paenibacillus sp. MMS18-CY102 TaxID=2682849 RepID=UPI001F009D1D|nr:endolytic transglycosylase MltG [Paenibacillus sp. MMS18-CY102]